MLCVWTLPNKTLQPGVNRCLKSKLRILGLPNGLKDHHLDFHQQYEVSRTRSVLKNNHASLSPKAVKGMFRPLSSGLNIRGPKPDLNHLLTTTSITLGSSLPFSTQNTISFSIQTVSNS